MKLAVLFQLGPPLAVLAMGEAADESRKLLDHVVLETGAIVYGMCFAYPRKKILSIHKDHSLQARFDEETNTRSATIRKIRGSSTGD